MATALYRLGRPNEAGAVLERLEHDFANDAHALVCAANLARAYAPPLACRLAARATEVAPVSAFMWEVYGGTLTAAGRHAEAVAAHTRHYELTQPPRVDGAAHIGAACRRAGDEPAALRWYETALAEADEWAAISDGFAAYYRAQALEGLGRLRGALRR